MDNFYLIVISIAIGLLIAILTYYGVVINKKAKKTAVYPPSIAQTCPDYWTLNNDGTCQIPRVKNVGNLGNGGMINNYTDITGGKANGSIDFNDKKWSEGAKNVRCEQKKWAISSKVMWDGITNFNGCK